MIRTLTIMILVLASNIMVFGQRGTVDRRADRDERVERLRRAYIRERLELTDEEGEKFWPMFNEYQKEKKGLREQIRGYHESLKSGETDVNKTIEIIDMITALRKSEADNDAAFLKRVLPVLGPDKTQRLIGLEEQFRKELMDRLRERRGQEGGPPPPRR